MSQDSRDLKELEWLAFFAQKHGLTGLVTEIKKAVTDLKTRSDDEETHPSEEQEGSEATPSAFPE